MSSALQQALQKKTDDYKNHPTSSTLEALQVDPQQGLMTEEVEKRRTLFGDNEIKEKEEPLWHRIFRRFWGPIPWMIEAAAAMSAAVNKWEDFTIIMMMLLVNAILDFMQEHKALNALKALKQKLENSIIARRHGQFIEVPFKDLVPGDIIKLKIGDIIPADVQLLEGDYLAIDESALTGESLPVNKKVGDVAYANTIVKQGEMLAVVVNTGIHTNFHKVVELVANAELHEVSHFQKMVVQIGNFLIYVTLAVIAVILIVAYQRHEDMMEIIRFALVLTVAAIPVALPAVLSVTMAVGAMNLARKQAIVSKLVAIEELAGVDVFCLDKTGTLTQNKMTVTNPLTFDGTTEKELFEVASLASKPENNDPIELPIFKYLAKHYPDAVVDHAQQIKFIPFDPVRKRTEAIIQTDQGWQAVTKGAAQVILSLSQLTPEQQQEIEQKVEELAHKGYRTLAIAKTALYPSKDDLLNTLDKPNPYLFLGLIPMYDPPREDSKEVLDNMRAHGVHPKMITGDNLAIAREIGRILGFPHQAIRAKQLSGATESTLKSLLELLTEKIYQHLEGQADKHAAHDFAQKVIDDLEREFDTSFLDKSLLHTHESSILEMIESVDIFAEVVPEDKYNIVHTLQKAGHIVGMTGDGVNDAPALKKADCGIAVPNATDAARAAADIILTAPGIGVINDAIQQARITFERMKSYAIYRIAETIRVILFMGLSIIVFNFYPVTAIMIIMLALLNDLPILTIAYDNTRLPKEPVRWHMGELLSISTILGVAGVISSFLIFFILEKMGFAQDVIQTIIFLKLVVAGHLTLFSTRQTDWFFKAPLPSAPLFWASLLSALAATFIAVYGFMITPISWEFAGWTWLYAFVWFLFNDTVKMATYHVMRKRGISV